jgi:hypothetical protein
MTDREVIELIAEIARLRERVNALTLLCWKLRKAQIYAQNKLKHYKNFTTPSQN